MIENLAELSQNAVLEYRELVIELAQDPQGVDEASIPQILCLVGKTIDDFRFDVGNLKGRIKAMADLVELETKREGVAESRQQATAARQAVADLQEEFLRKIREAADAADRAEREAELVGSRFDAARDRLATLIKQTTSPDFVRRRKSLLNDRTIVNATVARCEHEIREHEGRIERQERLVAGIRGSTVGERRQIEWEQRALTEMREHLPELRKRLADAETESGPKLAVIDAELRQLDEQEPDAVGGYDWDGAARQRDVRQMTTQRTHRS